MEAALHGDVPLPAPAQGVHQQPSNLFSYLEAFLQEGAKKLPVEAQTLSVKTSKNSLFF